MRHMPRSAAHQFQMLRDFADICVNKGNVEELTTQGSWPNMLINPDESFFDQKSTSSKIFLLSDFMPLRCVDWKPVDKMPLSMTDCYVPLVKSEAPAEFALLNENPEEWLACCQQVFGYAPKKDTLCRMIGEKVTLMGLRVGGHLAAVAMGYVHDGMAGIYFVGTLPVYRGRGVGSFLFSHSINFLLKHKGNCVCWNANRLSQHLWKKFETRPEGNMYLFLKRDYSST